MFRYALQNLVCSLYCCPGLLSFLCAGDFFSLYELSGKSWLSLPGGGLAILP